MAPRSVRASPLLAETAQVRRAGQPGGNQSAERVAEIDAVCTQQVGNRKYRAVHRPVFSNSTRRHLGSLPLERSGVRSLAVKYLCPHPSNGTSQK